jgi:hypothetical protein
MPVLADPDGIAGPERRQWHVARNARGLPISPLQRNAGNLKVAG